MDDFLEAGDNLVLKTDGSWSWKGWDGKIPVEAMQQSTANGNALVLETDIVQLGLKAAGKMYESPGFDVPGTTANVTIIVDGSTLSESVSIGGQPIATIATSGNFIAAVTPATNSSSGVPDPVPVKNGTWEIEAADAGVGRSGRPRTPPPIQYGSVERHWIAIELVDQDGEPIANEPVIITLPDGRRIERVLNYQGAVRVDGIAEAGDCTVEFPRLAAAVDSDGSSAADGEAASEGPADDGAVMSTEAAPGEEDAASDDEDDPADPRLEPALERARQEWGIGICEPPGNNCDRIDLYIRGMQGLGWDWCDPYEHDRDFAWCGAFAAYCYEAAGIRTAVRRDNMASTLRLWNWASGSGRMVPPDEVRPGDVVVMGPPTGEPRGAHIGICESVDLAARVVNTIEGNAVGQNPVGESVQGVIRRRRRMSDSAADPGEYCILYGVRPKSEDFDLSSV